MPFKKCRVRIEQAPWVNYEMLSMIDRREYLRKECRKCPCPYHTQLKSDTEKACIKLNNDLKRDYVENALNQHRHDPKKLWRAIRNLWPNSKKKQTDIRCIGTETDPTNIAEILNTHFSTVGKTVQNDIPNLANLSDFKLRAQPPSFDLALINEDKLQDAIAGLSNSRSTGVDGITAYMVKVCRYELAPVLIHIFNKSILDHYFPTLWKTAHVTPIFKSGNESSANNYRPISILSVLGKLLERIVHSQCYKYMSDRDLFCDAQSGFRKGRSTGTCLTEFLHHVYTTVDSGGACGALFLDLTKAFDTVDHKVLLHKLKFLGFKQQTVSWYKSYLTNRLQTTCVNGVTSSELPVETGVPQGSIFGPFLFCIYVNDLCIHLKHSTGFLYADDTALLVKR